MTDWHQLSVAETLSQLETDAAGGLPDHEAAQRRQRFGANELEDRGGRSLWQILWEQISGPLVLLLVVAALVSLFLGEYTDATVIFAIIVLNAALGFFQDYRAEKAMAALKKLAVPLVKLRRGGTIQEVLAEKLVPGDVILLEVGNSVPADCRLILSVNLKTQESALTGESGSVDKQTDPLSDKALPLGDRSNMAYMGTVVTYGHGEAVVTDIGMETELGHIADSLQTIRSKPTPLQNRLAKLGRKLAILAILIVAFVLGMGLLRGEDFTLMVMTALSLAVAVVPEGLPAVATVALAIGARKMFSRNALIRRLPAVETLGSVTVICSDKTGTLTQNQMNVSVLDVAGKQLELSQSESIDAARHSENTLSPVTRNAPEGAFDGPFQLLLTASCLCNDAELANRTGDSECQAVGDPTEAAMVVAAAGWGLSKNQLIEKMPRIAEVSFDSVRKRMTTVHRVDQNGIHSDPSVLPDGLTSALQPNCAAVAFTKGAVDQLIDSCEFVWNQNQPVPLTDDWRERILGSTESMASNGSRVLGVAFRMLCDDDLQSMIPAKTEAGDSLKPNEIESKLILIGMIGLIDPPRREAADAIARCRSAGIRPMMITGDHPLTAKTIAERLGITESPQVLTGMELDDFDADELCRRVDSVSVYARVAPEHKLRLVQMLQKKGHVVAMTGDGVNDAPALKQAHIGVAMGITGTDVSKEASEMILLDDNFATIVGAVEEGRVVYDNIRKFVKYTMTSNAGEVWVMVMGPLLGLPLPLLPLQILWVNLVTDGLPGLALAVEKAESNTMVRPPYSPKTPVFDRPMILDLIWIGLLMGIVSVAMGFYFHSFSAETHWRTIVFTVLTLSQMGNALAIRSSRDSLFQIGFFSNKALLAAVSLTCLLQLCVIYWEPFQAIFSTEALTFSELMLCVAVSSIVFWAVEFQKWMRRANDSSSTRENTTRSD